MAAFECVVEDTPAHRAIMDYLTVTGQIAEHVREIEGQLRLVLTEAEIDAVQAAGVHVSQGARLLTRSERDDVADTTDLVTGFVTGYLDALEIDAQITAIAAAHPAWCSVLTLPMPTAGYDGGHGPAVGPATVRALRITANPALRSRPGFLLVCGTHAREWMNPLIALEFAQQLLNNIDPTSADPGTVQATRIVTECDVIIVPVLNPDGLNFSIHDSAGWRKNRRTNAGAPSCPGVDVNRNYQVYFGGPGSSGSPCTDTYRGGYPLSESESANVRWLMEEFPNILVAVDSHSYGNAVFRPQPGGGSFIASLPVSPSDEAIYAALESTFVSAVSAVNGTVYSTGTTSNHAGTSDEYLFFAHRAFAFDTECGLSFQPSWTTAAPVVQEVVAGFRALAEATLDLTATTTSPLAAAQCIDATGSMVTFGYVTPARNNAKRFVDLMSLGDSAGIVTFADPSPDPAATPPADRAQTVLPMTVLDDPGDALAAMAAIDGISFGGWTSIGAGLDRAASLLSGAVTPRGILLLSDGFENRDPSVASVLSGWPPNLPIYTVALGPAADTTLLADIASQTGGQFQLSPTALDLHLVYNQMRADMSDVDTIVNELVDGERDEETCHGIDVDVGVDRLEVSLSSDTALPGKIVLLMPSGRQLSASDLGVRVTRRSSYLLIGIERPKPGRWSVIVGGIRAPYAVAAFARSPLRIDCTISATERQELALDIVASFVGEKLTPPKYDIRSHVVRPAYPTIPVEPLLRLELDPVPTAARMRAPVADLPDVVAGIRTPGPTASALPAQADRSPAMSSHTFSTKLVSRRPFAGPWLYWPRGRIAPPKAFSRAYVQLEGELPGGARYRRVRWKTVVV